MAHAVFAGIAELQGVDRLIPVAAGPVGVGIEAGHKALGAVQLQLGLEGRLLIPLHQGGRLLALVGEKERHGHGAAGIALAGGCRAAMPAEMQAVAVGPGPAGEAPGGGDLAVAEGQRVLAGGAPPALLLAPLLRGVVAPAGDQLQLCAGRQQHAHADGGGEQLGPGRARLAAAAVIARSWPVLAVGLFWLAQVHPIGAGEVVVGRVVALQRQIGVAGHQEAGGIPAAGQPIEGFRGQTLALGAEGLQHPLARPDQLQFQGGDQLAAHLG